MKSRLIKYAATAAMAAGMVFAQTATQPGQSGAATPAPGQHAVKPRAAFHRRMMQALNLTPAQQQQAKAIFQQAHQNAQPIVQQLRQNRQAMAAAVKSNDVAQIQSLSSQLGTLQGQVTAIRAESMAKFYSTLTPDQRTKADQMQQKVRQRIQQRKAGNNG